jgi:hypothetical protein
MKCLILLLALMKIIAFSRKHLSMRSRRGRIWQRILLEISSLDKRIDGTNLKGEVRVDIPLNDENNEITMFIPKPIANQRIMQGVVRLSMN